MSTHITEALSSTPSAFIKTLTFAGAKAFAKHQKIATRLEANTYFTRSYTSQDKETVENRIGCFAGSFQREQIFAKSQPSA